MIPKILHRIWIPGSPPMPEQFVKYGKDWKRLHPNWAFMFLWADAIPELQNQDLYDRAPEITDDYLRFRADLLRLEVLYQWGGVYTDTDVQPLKPFDRFLGDGCFLGVSPNSPPDRPLVTNTIIGAETGHPFIGYCIERIPEAVDEHRDRPVAQMVGPWHLTRCYDEWKKGEDPRVVVYPSSTFYPQSIKQRNRGETPDLSKSYAHHHWNTTALKRGIGYE